MLACIVLVLCGDGVTVLQRYDVQIMSVHVLLLSVLNFIITNDIHCEVTTLRFSYKSYFIKIVIVRKSVRWLGIK